jgi:DNA-binding cell septation regulator SpoVG
MDINLSEIQIVPTKPKNGLVAFVSFVINNQFFVGDIAIYTKIEGASFRLVYPNKILFNGLKINCFKPITKGVGEAIERAVLSRFENLMEHSRQREGNHHDESRVPAKDY